MEEVGCGKFTMDTVFSPTNLMKVTKYHFIPSDFWDNLC